ncbi:MAG TPA: hypothetical protein VFJ06_10645 [Halococcus sp.]|nr:hypothetical protein [Halococcus sp.]
MDDERFFSDIESRADFDTRDQAVADKLPENHTASLGSSGNEAARFSPDEQLVKSSRGR